jgi:hypothetical protein
MEMIKLFSILIVLCISLINGENQISTYNIPLKLNNTIELVLNRHVRQASNRNSQVNGTVNALASTEGVAQTGPINIKIRYFINVIILKSYSFIIIKKIVLFYQKFLNELKNTTRERKNITKNIIIITKKQVKK